MPAAIRPLVCCLTLLASLYAANARAQEDVEPRRAQVTIHSAPQIELEIIGRGAAELLAKCQGDCAFWALPGRYTVYTRDHTTGARHELKLHVKGFAEYDLVQGNDTVHDFGVGLEYAGAVSSVIGLLTVLAPLMSQSCESNCKDDNGHVIVIGLGILGAGIATGIVGFGLDTANRNGFVPHDQWSAASQRGPELRFGLVPMFAGLGLGGVARF